MNECKRERNWTDLSTTEKKEKIKCSFSSWPQGSFSLIDFITYEGYSLGYLTKAWHFLHLFRSSKEISKSPQQGLTSPWRTSL